MTSSNPLIFYDISSPLEPRSYAPNPSKTRLALGFKRIPFKTTFVDILDITRVRKQLNCPAVRKLDDGSDYYTLPMLQDPTTGQIIGDSFDIATYLDATSPHSGDGDGDGQLFPTDSTGLDLALVLDSYESPYKDMILQVPLTTPDDRAAAATAAATTATGGTRKTNGDTDTDTNTKAYARFNNHVDATFTANIGLYGYHLPFNPATADAVKALMCKRTHLASWEDICIRGEARQGPKTAFMQGLASLAALFANKDDEDEDEEEEEEEEGQARVRGPFVGGRTRATYADMIVGGWLNMLSKIMPDVEWDEFRTWHGGVWARLHDALQERYNVCT